MKQITRTLNIFLQQSWITAGAIILILAVLNALIFLVHEEPAESFEKSLRFSVFVNSVISVFVGIYLGGGVIKLKQTPMWTIYSHYKKNLLSSFFIAALLIGTIQSISLLYSGWDIATAILGPTAIIILTAQILTGKNIIMMLLFPAAPFILFQLTHYQVSNFHILVLLVSFASLAIFTMDSNRKLVWSPASIFNFSQNVKLQFNNPLLNRTNNWCVDFLQKFINTSPKGKIAVALIHPSTRYGISLLVSSLLIFFFMQLDDKNGLSPLIIFSAYIIAFLPITLLMEVQALSKQTKSFVHVLSSDQHGYFKILIAKMVDQRMIILTSLFTLFVIILASLFQQTDEIFLVIRFSITITLIFMAMQPLMLCLDWFNIGFKLLLAMSIYALSVFLLCRWHFQHELSELLSLEVLAVAILLISIRLISIRYWKRQPMEIFMRTFG